VPAPSTAARLLAASGGARRRARVEIIPLIDVIFFLLATFVLFTLSLNKSGGLAVALPATTTGASRDPTGAATVTLTAEGTLAWDKQPVTLDEFLARLRAYKQTAANPRVLLNADEAARFTDARYVVDEIRKAGLRVFVETRVAPAAP
jgi:biopolymer transport protein ExbD